MVKHIIIVVLIVSVFACTNSLISKCDTITINDIEKLKQKINSFYTTVLPLEMKRNEKIDYKSCEDYYNDIEMNMNDVYKVNNFKKLNNKTTYTTYVILDKWKIYKEEHRNYDSISKGLMLLNKMTIDDLLNSLKYSENLKQK